LKSHNQSALFCTVFLTVFLAAGQDGPLNQEKNVLCIAFGTLVVYPPEINRYLAQVEQTLNAPLFPRRLLIAHGIEIRREFRPLPFLDLSPWIAGMYSARRFRSVYWNFFVPDIRVPVVIRLADLSTGLRVQCGGYLAAEKLRLRGGFSISEHFTRLHVIEDTDHELTAFGTQLSFVAGCQFRLFDRVFFDCEVDLPTNLLPLRVTAGSSFNQYELTRAAPLPKNVHLWNVSLRPEVRIDLKKRRLPDVL
jgi:hypothetical protein